MNFRSDNETGAHPAIIEAVSRAFAAGNVHSYGADSWTRKVENRLREIFEKPDLSAYPVATGTAANVLALAACQVSKDDQNDTISATYNQDVAENAAADVGNFAEDVANDVGNTAEDLGEKAENVDVDVDLNTAN